MEGSVKEQEEQGKKGSFNTSSYFIFWLRSSKLPSVSSLSQSFSLSLYASVSVCTSYIYACAGCVRRFSAVAAAASFLRRFRSFRFFNHHFMWIEFGMRRGERMNQTYRQIDRQRDRGRQRERERARCSGLFFVIVVVVFVKSLISVVVIGWFV